MSEMILTPSAAARLCEMSEGWVRHAADTGKLPCIVTTTGRRLFKRSDVLALKEKMGDKPAPAEQLAG
jgi:hypothetical protein